MTTNTPAHAQPRYLRIAHAAVILTALVAALALLVLSGVLGAGNSSWSFGPFAGYVWRGHVTSLSASWTVPEGSSCGVASTWIGATALGNPSFFIQTGTNEQRCVPQTSSELSEPYFAFWTDFAHNVEPQPLFTVNAGDDLKASLAFTRGRCTLTIADTTTGAHARFSISVPSDAAINQAGWTQEDVTDSTRHHLYPYPHLTTVGFRDLEINSQPPTYPDLYSSWMSVGSTNLAPTPLYHDSFIVREAKVSKYGAQYLHIAKLEDTATEAFIPELARWTADTPRSQIDSARSRYATALRDNISAFTSVRWQAQAQGLVDALIGKTRVLFNHTQSPVPTSSAGIAIWRSVWTRDADAIGNAAHPLKRELDLPEFRPTPRY